MKQSKGSLGLVILFIVLGVILIGGGYFIWQKNSEPSPRSPAPSDETENWQVYTNDTHNYKIKYPQTWHFHRTGYAPPPPTAIVLSTAPEGETQGDYAQMEISALPATGETLNENGEIQSLVADGYSKNSMTLSGQPAIKLGNTGRPQDGGLIYCLYEQKIYRLNWGATTKELFLAHQDTFGKMIDTFAFSNQ